MSGLAPAARPLRRRFRALAIAAAAVQLLVVAAGPLVEGGEGPSAPVHIERFGTSKHFSHNPDDCAACLAATLVAAPPRAALAVVPAVLRVAAPETRRAPRAVRVAESPKSPRAPPADSRRAG